MALIKIELPAQPVDGMDIKFKAPCDCSAITGLLVTYPEGSQEFTFRDCHGNNVAGIGGLFAEGAYVKAIVDVERSRAYLQNADNNGFLNSAIFGSYIHSGETLTGVGENGKFKATASGTISSIIVNGVSCSVKCGEESSMDLIAGCWYTFILDGDTVNFNAGGAGAGLNFTVVGGTTVPASPSENMIWVNTDVPITGWIFSAAQPETAAEGEVWIATGTSSPSSFNALKKNGIVVYPISAKQYIGGAWASKTALSYQAGAWEEWLTELVLYDSGDECIDITGGWEKKNKLSSSSANGSMTKNADYVYLKNVSSATVGMVTVNEIDLTNFSQMHCLCKCTGEMTFTAAPSFPTTSASYLATGKFTGPNNEVVSVDISEVSGKARIGVFENQSSGTYVYKVWLS